MKCRRNGKKGSQKGSHTGGSYWYAMVRRALKRVCPELVANAEQHAAGITKIGLNGMFESVEVPSEEEPSVLSRGGRRWGQNYYRREKNPRLLNLNTGPTGLVGLGCYSRSASGGYSSQNAKKSTISAKS